jgi:hypothetical protein
MSLATRERRLPGEPPQPICERCDRPVDPAAIGSQVGLCHCPACDLFACRWCWSEAGGLCPGCGVAFGVARGGSVVRAAEGSVVGAAAQDVAAKGAVIAAPHAPVPARRTRSLRRPILTVTMAVLAVAIVGVLLGGQFRAGGVESARDVPAALTSESAGVPLASPGGAGSVGSGTPATTVSGATPDPITLASPSGAATVTPRPTPAATPRPTTKRTSPPGATPSPSPVPRPTPTQAPTFTPAPTETASPGPSATPAPTAACISVPDLIGMTVGDARAAWAAAGFTGSFSPGGNGPNDKVVSDQSEPAGACMPESTAITVHF